MFHITISNLPYAHEDYSPCRIVCSDYSRETGAHTTDREHTEERVRSGQNGCRDQDPDKWQCAYQNLPLTQNYVSDRDNSAEKNVDRKKLSKEDL